MSDQLGSHAHIVHRVNLTPSDPLPPVRRASTGISADAALNRLMSIVAPGAGPGDSFPIHLGDDNEIRRFKAAAQTTFLETYAIEDLEAALALSIKRGWLELGRRYGNCGEVQSYRITEAGIEASKTDRST